MLPPSVVRRVSMKQAWALRRLAIGRIHGYYMSHPNNPARTARETLAYFIVQGLGQTRGLGWRTRQRERRDRQKSGDHPSWLQVDSLGSLSDAVDGPFLGHRKQLLYFFPSRVGRIQLLLLG